MAGLRGCRQGNGPDALPSRVAVAPHLRGPLSRDQDYLIAENNSKPEGTCPGVLPSITSRATSTPRSTVSGL